MLRDQFEPAQYNNSISKLLSVVSYFHSISLTQNKGNMLKLFHLINGFDAIQFAIMKNTLLSKYGKESTENRATRLVQC